MLVLMSALMLLSGCERQSSRDIRTGKVGFSLMGDELNTGLKSVNFDDSTSTTQLSLLISVADADSNLILDKKIIPLYVFGNQYISEKIELNEGYYFLTEFMVVNSSGEVVYAAPKRGSELDYLVSHPLPVDFKVIPGTESNLEVEVIAVNDYTPDQFGYVSFSIQVVTPLVFYACVYDPNPLIFGPTDLIPAKVSIADPEGRWYEFNFKALVNEITVRKVSGYYSFQVETDSYFGHFKYSYTQLMATSAENPLRIPAGDSLGYHELIIRTSPDSTDDALITDLNPTENFGDSKELSASFLTEPVLTVMRTRRSLIRFDFDNALPKSATIQKIELSLHLTGGVQGPYNEYMDTMIAGVLKAVVEPWDEHTVTWDNQPQTTEDVMMYLDYRPWMSTSLRVYDITDLIKKSWQINTPVYGFMLQHYPENVPGGITFASSDNDYVEMRPGIKIYYTLP